MEYELIGKGRYLQEIIGLMTNPEIGEFEWVYLDQEEGTVKKHLEYLALVKYCFEVLEWDYAKLMSSQVPEEELLEQLISYGALE